MLFLVQWHAQRSHFFIRRLYFFRWFLIVLWMSTLFAQIIDRHFIHIHGVIFINTFLFLLQEHFAKRRKMTINLKYIG